MILYESDWKRYPTAIADLNSLNKSWVEQAAKYKSMGIKHWYFCLTLYTPSLSGVDPHDPNLDHATKHAILLECAHNPWYVLREVIKVPATSGGGGNPLRANRGNIAMFWCVFNSFITYVQQIRQTGKTLNTRALVVLFHLFMAKGSQHILFTKGDLRKDEIKNYKLMRSMIPIWMWGMHAKDTDNQHEFTNHARGNVTKSYIPQGDPEAANTVGRGTTPTLVNVDEPPFLPYAAISIPSLIASTTASFDEARSKGKMHAILYTTTAGDLSTDSGRYVYDMIKKKSMFFSEILFDCLDRNDAIRMILANSTSKVPHIDISFNHLQLGYTDEWLREKIAAVPAKKDQIKRDYMGQWTFGSTANPIDEKYLNKIRDNTNEWPVVVRDPKLGYTVRYHLPIDEVKRRVSVMGLDTSNAVGRDAITGVMIDVETSETLCAFMIGEASLLRFGEWLAQFIADHPLMTLIPEARSSWDGIRDALIALLPNMGIDPGRRIYSRIVHNAKGSETEKRDYRDFSYGSPTERKYFPFRADFGFPTNGTLRDALYGNILDQATRDSPTLVRDSILIDELSSLVLRNNRIDHKASGHDDHVISWLMANWFLRSSFNLSHYGIDSQKVLSKVRTAAAGDDPKEKIKVMREQRLAQEIDKLEAMLGNARSVMEQRYLEAKIVSLKSEQRGIDADDGVGSIDKTSTAAKAEKMSQRERNNLRPSSERTGGHNGYFQRGSMNLSFRR